MTIRMTLRMTLKMTIRMMIMIMLRMKFRITLRKTLRMMIIMMTMSQRSLIRANLTTVDSRARACLSEIISIQFFVCVVLDGLRLLIVVRS